MNDDIKKGANQKESAADVDIFNWALNISTNEKDRFNAAALEFPLTFTEDNYRLVLEKVFGQYRELLESYFNDQQIKSKLKHLNPSEIKDKADFLSKIILKYLNGLSSGNHLKAERELYDNICKNISDFESLGRVFRCGETLFRKRNEANILPKDMFHLPYSLIRKCSTQRFSVPGYPCLYLGCSESVCDLEIPNVGDKGCTIARFILKPENSFNVLDLTLSGFGYDLKKYGNYLALWPLLAACNFHHCPHDEDRSYKEEYAIPQFLAKFVREELDEMFVGIMYYTVNCRELNPHIDTFKNVMLFTNKKEGENYDEDLRDKFEIDIVR